MTKASPLWVVLVLAIFGACSRQAAPQPAAQKAAAAVQSSAAAPQPDANVQTVKGTVVETMDSGGYTYLRVKTAIADIWVATAPTKVSVGDQVTVPLQTPMQDFHSPTLKRDFPVIYFVTGVEREGGDIPVAPIASHGSPGVSSATVPHADAAPATAPISVGRAPNGLTVAEVWAQRASLNGKTVTVRGKVVKVNPGIMDRNWIHIQDGTGSVADGSNDLTVTSRAEPKVGDVITVSGKVAVNKDFTAGYVYGVIVENATIR